MNTIDRYGNNIKFQFHFSDSSFKKVVDATSLFDRGKCFVLTDYDKTYFIIYAPEYLCTIDAIETNRYETIQALQTQLGIHLLCFDLVAELNPDMIHLLTPPA